MEEIIWKREKTDNSWILIIISEWVILFAFALILYDIYLILIILIFIGVPAICYLNYITYKHREKLEIRRNFADIRISERGIIVFYKYMTDKYGLPYSVTLKENEIDLFYGLENKTPTGIKYDTQKGIIYTFNNDINIRNILNEMVVKYDFFIDKDIQKRINIENLTYFMNYEKEKHGYNTNETGIVWKKTRIVFWIISYFIILYIILTFVLLIMINVITGNIEKTPINGLIIILFSVISMLLFWLPVRKYLLNFNYHYPDMYYISNKGLHYKYKSTGCNEIIKWNYISSVQTFTLPFLLLVETTEEHPTSPALRFSTITNPDANFIFYMTPTEIKKVKKMVKTRIY